MGCWTEHSRDLEARIWECWTCAQFDQEKRRTDEAATNESLRMDPNRLHWATTHNTTREHIYFNDGRQFLKVGRSDPHEKLYSIDHHKQVVSSQSHGMGQCKGYQML